jgi:hypothetical protein
MYKLFAKTDGNGNVIDAKTQPFAKGEGWTEIGEQEGRHYHIDIIDREGVYQYKLKDSVIIERTNTEKNADKLPVLKAQKIERARQATIRKLAEKDAGYIAKKTEIENANTLTAINNIKDL